jgi:hypothetical protein
MFNDDVATCTTRAVRDAGGKSMTYPWDNADSVGEDVVAL